MSIKAIIRDASSAPRVTVVPNPNLKGPSHCLNECEHGTEKLCSVEGCQADKGPSPSSPHYAADVLVSERDGIFTLRLNTKKAHDWVAAHRPKNAMGLGPALVTEPEYVDDIIAQMRLHGLEVR